MCSPARVKVVCTQHTCESLKNNPIELWSLLVQYWHVDANGDLVHAIRFLNASNATLGTWYALDHAIIQSSALPAGSQHKLTAELVDNEVAGIRVAISELYAYFDCNSTDGVVTQHKFTCNASLRNPCQLYSQNSITALKILTVTNNCANSSPGSASYTPLQEIYPCSVNQGG